MNDHLRQGFTRARRFLVAVSLGLACFNVLKLQISQVSILGNTASVGRPEHIAVLVWIAWIWALLQYIVWFRDVGAWDEFKGAIWSDCSRALGRKILKEGTPGLAKEQLPRELGNRLGTVLRAESLEYRVTFEGVDDAGPQTGKAAQIHTTATARMPNHSVERSSTLRTERPISDSEWRRYYIRAVLWALLSRRFVPEYFAPFLISVLPLIV